MDITLFLRSSSIEWIGYCLTWLVILASARQVGAQAVDVDPARAQRYADRLNELQTYRNQLRQRAATLLAQTPNLEQDLQQATQQALIAAGTLNNTPGVIRTPQLLQTLQVYRGQSGELFLRPELLVWYVLQDNTWVRQQLFQIMATAQQSANQSYATLLSSRAALEQISRDADANFLDFRELADVMGRRSLAEHTTAETLTAAWYQDDPLHAGAALVRAHALRSLGRFDECKRILNQIDDNFPAVQAVSWAISGQIAFLSGDTAEAKRDLEKGISAARGRESGEAELLLGWIAMTEGKWSHAKSHAGRARKWEPDSCEVAILEGLATAQERPGRAREALQVLRRARLATSPDDWHYHEALAIVHALANDRQFAQREIQQAVSIAPSHVRAELEREQQSLVAGRMPDIDWTARLQMLWQPH